MIVLRCIWQRRRVLARLEMSPEKQRKYADFIDFYADLSEEEVIRYRDSYLSEKGEVMGLVSVLKEEGRIATLFHVQNTQRRMGRNYVVSKAVR